MTLETAPLYLVALVVLAIVVGLVAGAVVALRRISPGARRVGHALDDIIGEDARPGVERRPGIVERQAKIEEHLTRGFAEHARRFDKIEERLAVSVDGTTARLDEHGRRLDVHGHRLDEHGKAIAAVVARVEALHPDPPEADHRPGPH